MTIGFHVHRNDALVALDPSAAGSAAHWTRYIADPTAWTHLRTARAAAATLTASIRIG